MISKTSTQVNHVFDAQSYLTALEPLDSEERLQSVLTQMPTFAALPSAQWITLKPHLKQLVPTISLNDLEHLRTEARHELHIQIQAALPEWQRNLHTTSTGKVLQTEDNIHTIFTHHPVWLKRFWWDAVAQRPYLDEEPLDIHRVRNILVPWLGKKCNMPIYNGKNLLEVLRSLAHQRQRDPIQEWLSTLPPEHSYTYLHKWLIEFAGAEDTPGNRFISRVLLVSLVARALTPGIQYRYVVVLEGKENLGKTKLLRILGDRWHQEFPKSVEGKEAYMQLQGYWLVELGELDALRPAEESRIKMFISQQMDIWVPKYGNDPTEIPRRAILVGTTNEREYLKGEHGNTRYLPIWLPGPIDTEAITQLRDRLFSQAKGFLEEHPDDWWTIPAEAQEEITLARNARREATAYDEKVADFIDSAKKRDWAYHTEEPTWRCTMDKVFEHLEISLDRWESSKKAVGKAMRNNGLHRWSKWNSATKQMERFWSITPQD